MAKKTSSLGILTYHAVACSLDAVAVVANDQTSTLALHIGIGASEISGNHVGGILNRWEFYISGDAVAQMSLAEANAEAGQVVISAESHRHLHEVGGLQIDSTALQTGTHLVTRISGQVPPLPQTLIPQLSPEIVQCISSYIPGTITSTVTAGKTINDGCLRKISVLFISVHGILDIQDPFQQLERADKSFAAIQEAAYHVKGTIRQFIIDDKGAIAIAAVGLPPFYHEDNAVRAAKMANRLRKKEESLSIGITTGMAFCGSVGSLVRSEYAVVGDCINLAARFAALANHHEVLCDATTYRAIHESFDIPPGRYVQLKGQKDPVIVYKIGQVSVTNHLANVVEHNPVGVDSILKHFKRIEEDVLAKMTESSGGRLNSVKVSAAPPPVLFITGESGTGKSTVVQQCLRLKCPIICGQTDSVEMQTSYYSLQPILAAILGATTKEEIPAVDLAPTSSFPGASAGNNLVSKYRIWDILCDEEETRNSALNRRQSNDALPQKRIVRRCRHSTILYALAGRNVIDVSMIPLLNMVLPIDLPETSHTLSLNQTERHATLLRLLFALIQEVSSVAPIVLVFDDAHFIDDASAYFLHKLCQKQPKSLYLILALRKEAGVEYSANLTSISTIPRAEKIELGLFTQRETGLLLGTQYGISVVDPSLLHFILQRSGGLPSSMVAVINHLISSGTISINEENGTATILKPLEQVNTQIPGHIYAKVTAVMDSLSRPVQLALRIGSVCNNLVSLTMIVYIRNRLFGARQGKCLHVIEAKDIGEWATMSSQEKAKAEMKLVHELSELKHRNVVSLSMESGGIEFLDDNVRMVICNTILASHRAAIHESAVSWYEKEEHKLDQYQYHIALGGHLMATGCAAQALEHFELAAKQALLSGLIPESLECLKHANDALGAMRQDEKCDKKELEMWMVNIEFLVSQTSIIAGDFNKATQQLRQVVSQGEKFEVKKKTYGITSRFVNKKRDSAKKDLKDKLLSNVEVARTMLASIIKAEKQRLQHIQQLRTLSQLSICNHGTDDLTTSSGISNEKNQIRSKISESLNSLKTSAYTVVRGKANPKVAVLEVETLIEEEERDLPSIQELTEMKMKRAALAVMSMNRIRRTSERL